MSGEWITPHRLLSLSERNSMHSDTSGIDEKPLIGVFFPDFMAHHPFRGGAQL
jgi:hypothetical protein